MGTGKLKKEVVVGGSAVCLFTESNFIVICANFLFCLLGMLEILFRCGRTSEILLRAEDVFEWVINRQSCVCGMAWLLIAGLRTDGRKDYKAPAATSVWVDGRGFGLLLLFKDSVGRTERKGMESGDGNDRVASNAADKWQPGEETSRC